MKNMRFFTVLMIVVFFGFSSVLMAQTRERPTPQHRMFPASVGNLSFKTFGLAFPGITINSVMTDTVYVVNNWTKPMTLSFKSLPDYITCKIIPETLKPQEEGKIAVTFDAKKKGEYGRIIDHINLMTNDTVRPEKRIILSPDVLPDFSVLTPEERAGTPVITFDNKESNFGTINEGDVVTVKYPFKNTGKRALEIYSVKGSCGCTKAQASATTVEPGQTGDIEATFNAKHKKGDQRYNITVITNDVNNPSTILTISGNVKQESGQK